MLDAVVDYTARRFRYAMVMPNLVPPITSTATAAEYRDRILAAAGDHSLFNPLITLYCSHDIDLDDLRSGIELADGTSNNFIFGNYIGTDPTGLIDMGNGENGVLLSGGTTANMIGGPGASEGNIISGNTGNGIRLEDSNTDDNTIQGNYIGVDVNGTLKLGNDDHGISINTGVGSTFIGGLATTEGNVISGNNLSGIRIYGNTSNHEIKGNFIGTNFDGTVAVGNNIHGITISGGSSNNVITEGNVVSGNAQSGIEITGTTSNYNIKANFIGTNFDGTVAIGNGEHGIVISGSASHYVIGSANTAERNVISGNGNRGISISDSTSINNEIIGNYIGTDATGSAELGNGSS